MNYQKSDNDLMKLQTLLAEKRAEVPKTDVEGFLIELHRRQRAQLLRRQVDSGLFAKTLSFVKGLVTPAYGTAFACAAVGICYVGIHSSQDFVSADRDLKPVIASAPTVALSPNSLSSEIAQSRAAASASSSASSSLSKLFSSTRFSKLAASAQSAELFIPRTLHDSPRFLLANSQVAYDARASF